MAATESSRPERRPHPHRAEQIGLLYAPDKETAQELAAELEEWLTRLGLSVWRGCAEDARRDGDPGGPITACDLLFTLGGDGTALRAARVAAPLGIPLVPVGLGRLSFMAELTPDDVLKKLPAFLAGDYWIEERALVEGTALRGGQPIARALALNEILLARERCALTLRVAVRVNGAYLTTYVGDGVIAATATGSTAYALSAGGPILVPESRDLLLVPVAAHLCLLRPLVLPEDAWVELEVVGGTEAGVNTDGQPMVDLQPGDSVQVRRSATSCSFARLQDRNYFYRTLKARLYQESGREQSLLGESEATGAAAGL